MIIATAGHVDHGKTALVRALTGVETDRLAEEQRRGLTIELCYAYGYRGDTRCGFADLQGHESFLAPSLAGLAAARLALLAVAADEGPKPQTEAHLRCLQGFAFTGLVVALTRYDLASEAQQQAAGAALEALVERYGFSSATVVPTSIHDPASLDPLEGRGNGSCGPRQGRWPQGAAGAHRPRSHLQPARGGNHHDRTPLHGNASCR